LIALTISLVFAGLCLSLAGCLSGGKQDARGVLHGDLAWPGEVPVAGDVILAEDVNLTGNFWVQPEGSTFEHVFYDGRRTPYLGRVLIEPLRTTSSVLAGLSWNP
jgi:hypothetical protein